MKPSGLIQRNLYCEHLLRVKPSSVDISPFPGSVLAKLFKHLLWVRNRTLGQAKIAEEYESRSGYGELTADFAAGMERGRPSAARTAHCTVAYLTP